MTASQSQEETINKVFRIEYNSIIGRHLVANKNIEAGEVIIDEEALVCGPVIETVDSTTTKLLLNYHNNFNSVCCVCFQCYHYEGVDQIICDDCQTSAFCSSHCAHAKLHKDNECTILREIKSEVKNLGLTEFYNLITTIRLLFLRASHPVSWKQVLSLQSKVDNLNDLGTFSVIDRVLEKFSWNDFQFKEDELDLSKQIITLKDAARHCLGVMRINAYSLIKNSMRFEGLYFFTSLLSHSCIMNTDRQFDVERGRMIVKAAVKIAQGTPITTTYLSPMNNTKERQAEMMKNWLFSCSCSRCQDETELGMFLSTVTFSGSLESDPLFESDGNSRGVEDVVGRVKECMPKNIEDIDSIECWLTEFDNEKYLHGNHSVFSQVKLYLSHVYGRQHGGVQGLSSQQLFRKYELCLEILQIYNILYAGLYQCRGELLFELWTTLREMNQRGLVYKEALLTEEKVVMEAHEILQHAPKNSSHAQMNQILIEECSSILKINHDY